MKVPYFLLKSYVGLATALETVETVYRNIPDGAGRITAESPGQIKNIIFHDPFHAGYNPLSHVTTLNVVCKIDDYRTPRNCFNTNGQCEHGPTESAYVRQSELKACFEHLLAIPKKSDLYLDVTFQQRKVRLAVLVEALETFKEVHTVLCEAGAYIHVEWQYSRGWDIDQDAANINAFFQGEISHDDFKAQMPES
jgi:hypothetical protein